ncbi:MAG: GAF domain-containing protein [Bryobacteraceae bacterium]
MDSTTSKQAMYQRICEQLQELLGRETDLIANAANTSAFLFRTIPDINWVGFYLAKQQELVLGPFQGNTACTRIPFGKGVCGTAAQRRETVVVPDVEVFPGHIVCDTASRSEMVVPLMNWGRLLGVLDVDSATLNRFDEDDQEGFESIGSVFMASLATEDLPDLREAAARAGNRGEREH